MATFSRIAGTGSYLPERILTNADLEKIVETSDEWIVSRSGIRERHIAAEGETTATEEIAPEPVGNVTVSVDHATLDPNALASGDVTFSDGVTGKWVVDHSGRPGFTEISQPGYRPSPEDGQDFMQELSQALQKKGM